MGIETLDSSMQQQLFEEDNRILSLKTDDGRWIDDQGQLKNMADSYFQNLYAAK